MKFRHLAVASLAVLGMSHWTCQSVPLTAPPGSAFELIANPTFIPANGGVSRITAIVTEPAGTPVADGTVIFFVTDLGRIDERARTNDGIAQVNLIADARSGVAHVLAFSGGASDLPSSVPSSSPTTSLQAAPTVHAFAGQAVLAAANSDTVDVTIGNARTSAVHVRADPTRIGASRTTTVIATVFGEDSNPVANAPVYFRVTEGTATETFDNPGPVFTDNNGEARSTLRTRRDFAGGTTTVVAEAPGPNGTMETSDELVIPVF